MELKNRVAIITHENLSELLNLYGELNIDEIKEDLGNAKQSAALQRV